MGADENKNTSDGSGDSTGAGVAGIDKNEDTGDEFSDSATNELEVNVRKQVKVSKS